MDRASCMASIKALEKITYLALWSDYDQAHLPIHRQKRLVDLDLFSAIWL